MFLYTKRLITEEAHPFNQTDLCLPWHAAPGQQYRSRRCAGPSALQAEHSVELNLDEGVTVEG
jgi:hypothetical protein